MTSTEKKHLMKAVRLTAATVALYGLFITAAFTSWFGLYDTIGFAGAVILNLIILFGTQYILLRPAVWSWMDFRLANKRRKAREQEELDFPRGDW